MLLVSANLKPVSLHWVVGLPPAPVDCFSTAPLGGEVDSAPLLGRDRVVPALIPAQFVVHDAHFPDNQYLGCRIRCRGSNNGRSIRSRWRCGGGSIALRQRSAV